MNKIKDRAIFNQKGQAMLLSVILFLGLSLIAVFGMINPIFRHASATRSVLESKQGYYLAEAGIEDIVYRLKNAMSTSATNILSLNGESVSTSVTNTAEGITLESVGDSHDYLRKLEVNLIPGIGVAFNYGVQTGTGGFVLSNNSGVNGNVYSNGPIVGGTGSFITASAFSANSATSTIDQENTLPSTPLNQVIFGDDSSTEDFAQSFTVSTTGPIGKVAFYIKKTSNPANITVRIAPDNSGVPSATTLSSATLPATLITTSYGWVELPLSTPFDLVSGTTYWIVLDASSNNSKYYTIAAGTGYTNGQGKIGKYGVSFGNTTPTALDGYFKIFLGGLTGSIDGVDIGTSGTGDGRAHTVTNSDITGSLYCQTGSGNNKSCDTSAADPTPLPLPVSQANIDHWKDEADDGTIINGNVSLSDSTSSLGPTKIIGDLAIDNNYTLTLTGTVWVTGNITLSNNVTIRLAPGYGASSGSIISDGRISLSNNTLFQGSGNSQSYVMLLSTSECPNGISCGGNPAISVGNNAGTVIINAQNGTVEFSNNAGAKGATGNLISLSNNATITYETGLASTNFVGGPSGGYDVESWREVE